MAIVISGVNKNDKILASDGVLDSISGINAAGIVTATSFTGDLTGDVTGNLTGNVTGNVNATSNLLLQIGGSEKFRVASSGQLGIGGANYGSAGQVLTSGGSGSAATWSTISSDSMSEGNTKAEVVDTGSDGHFKVETEGSERIRIDSSGGLRINTTRTQATKLHVVGGTASGTSYDAAVFAGGQNSTQNSGVKLYLTGCENDPLNRGVILESIMTDNSNAHKFIVKVSGSSAAPTERFHIDSSGNFKFTNGGDTNIITRYSTNGGPYILFDNRGNNTTDNSNTYNIGGIAAAGYRDVANPSIVAAIQFERQPTASGASSGGNILFRTGFNGTTSHTGVSERMRINYSGNLAIGNSNPQKKIHISTTGNQKLVIDPNYADNSSGSANSEANANNIVESILIRSSYGDNAASSANAGHKWGIKFQGYNGNDFTQARSKCAAVYAVSEDTGAGYNRNVGLAFHTSQFDTSHREVMRINTNGIVTKPYQYVFTVETSSHSKSANWSQITGLTIRASQSTGVSNGTYWSNSTDRFTAPVAGIYYFYCGGWATSASNGSRYAYTFKHQNGNHYDFIGGGNYCLVDSPMDGFSRTIKLSAGEWVELWGYSSVSTTWGGGHRFFWGGYLLG